MRKIFFTLVCMVAMTIGAYAQQNVPAAINAVVENMRNDCFNDDDPEFECGGVKIEGQNIVVIGYMDESEFGGLGIKDAFEMAGITGDDLAREMRKDFFKGMDEDDKQDIDAMVKYKYNLVIRFVGKQSKQRIDAKLNYWELAQ